MTSQVPERSSKRTRPELETERDEIQNQVKKMRKALKPQASFNPAIWIQNAEIAMKSRRAVSLQTEISEQDYQEQGLEAEFSQSEKAKSLREQFNALEAEERLLKEQAELVSTENTHADERKSRARAFIELFTTSRIGLAITSTGRGRRDTSVQSQFRAECIKAYNSSNPNPRKEFLWCPILKTWVQQDHATAAHLFTYVHGQDVMNSIFGVMKPPELFSSRNGIIISNLVEKKLDKGFMAIVPRLSNHSTPAQIQLWNSSEPKQYKIRILDLKDPDVHNFIRPDSDQTWKDLDGTNVEFRSTFRPRARYLYFYYCIQILRRAWKADRSTAEQMKKEFKAGFWGTKGPYLPGSMLRAFIEELGHGYEELWAGAIDDRATANPGDRNTLLAIGARQVYVSRDKEGEDEDEDEEETDEDADEEETDEDEDEEETDEDEDEEETDEDNDEEGLNKDGGGTLNFCFRWAKGSRDGVKRG